jgi:hypothetical protein
MILFVLVEIGNESVWLISRITGPQRTVLTFLQLASCPFFPSYVTCRPSLSTDTLACPLSFFFSTHYFVTQHLSPVS